MKKKLFLIFGILTIILFVLISSGYYSRNEGSNESSNEGGNMGGIEGSNENISMMHTDENYKTTYSVYNTYNKSDEKIFSRKNQNFSDFSIDKRNNNIYFSELVNNKYDIYKVELSNKNEKVTSLLGDTYSGDIFDFNNEKIIFRTLAKNHISYTLGVCFLTNNTTDIWSNEDSDSDIYNFYWDKEKSLVYTVERSNKEVEVTEFPEIPNHKIFKYDENGDNKQLIYSTNKYIDNISLNKQGNKIVFDATTIEDSVPIKKIYLLDLDNNTEQILIDRSDTNFNTIKNPQISLNGDGFYFLATTPKSKIIQQVELSTPILSNSIYYYNFNSKKTNIIFGDNKFVINSFKLN